MTRSDRAWRWTALAVIACVAFANAWHVAFDRTPPTWDDAWYLENSFRFFHALQRGPWAFAVEYASSFRTKAPLISLLPLPVYAVVGLSERAAIWANQACWAACVTLVLALGRRLYGERAGWAAAAAYALIPLSYGLSRLFFVESVLTMLVCAFYLQLLRRSPSRRSAAELGATAGLGLLAKSIFPLYAAGGLWKERKSLRAHAALSVAAAALVAGSWYAFNAVYVAGYAYMAGFGRVARDYGDAAVFAPAVLQQYAMRVGGDALSWPWLSCAAAACLLAGRKAAIEERDRAALLWLLFPLAVFTLGVNKDIRFLAPALPALALLVGARVEAAAVKRGGALALGLALPPLMVLGAQTWGLPWDAPLAYNGPARPAPGWDRGAVLGALAGSAQPASVVAVAFEHRWLNANSLASLCAERGLPWRFVNLGYSQASSEGALIRLKDKGADHLIIVEGEIPPDLPAFLNRANDGVAAAVASGRLRTTLVGRAAVTAGLTAAVYRLTP